MRNILYIILTISIVNSSCDVSAPARHQFKDISSQNYSELSSERSYLKAHLKDGRVAVFGQYWTFNEQTSMVTGRGKLYDVHRNATSLSKLQIPVSEVALFETNQMPNLNAQIAALGVMAGINLTITTLCITNPKACFGSCPTFYLEEEENVHYSDAEGFSNAILPSMAYADVDALPGLHPSGSFSLIMKNEALETHVLQQTDLLIFPVLQGTEVLQGTDKKFYRCSQEQVDMVCDDPEVQQFIKTADHSEYFAPANARDMDHKEEIIFDFNTGGKEINAGVEMHFRQSLMTTYLIYSALGYMGTNAVEFLAEMERKKTGSDQIKSGIFSELGKVDVYLQSKNGNWVKQGGFYETGPIAINRQMQPLNIPLQGKGKIKIVFNSGLWRFDKIALREILNEDTPAVISPERLVKNGIENEAGRKILHSKHGNLISLPGDRFKIHYQLPGNSEQYHVFLQSKGYYLEWIRNEWISEENHLKLYRMFNEPDKYLREEAGAYKQYEKDMEQVFWASRIPCNFKDQAL